jgi:hypothetical protein
MSRRDECDPPLEARVLRALDACRPTGNDRAQLPTDVTDAAAADPRYDAWLKQSAQFDAAVAATFRQVPVPAGLEARLALTLAAEELAESTDAPLTLLVARQAGTRTVSRRVWIAAAGVALAGTLSGRLWSWVFDRFFQSPPLALEQVRDQLLDFHKLTALDGVLIPSTEKHPHAPLISAALVPQIDPQWRALGERTILGYDVDAYELAPADAPRATYYKLRARRGAAPIAVAEISPPRHPGTTGGYTCAVWIEHDHYVALVVEGDEARYEKFLQPPPVVV